MRSTFGKASRLSPSRGSWKRLQDHILNVVCSGNTEHRDWLMGWMARLVQRPGEQGEVAVVMRGIEGAGKGTLAKALLHILGQHGLAISNAKHLTGNFNGHLRDYVLLFADEAFFAGDRAHVGVLKALITEPTLTIEAKFQNAVQMPNFVHLMMASNEDWVVPASLEARRFFVLEVSAAKANDHAYFAAIWAEMEDGGYEAMLHDLLDHDLTFFNHRKRQRPPVCRRKRNCRFRTPKRGGWKCCTVAMSSSLAWGWRTTSVGGTNRWRPTSCSMPTRPMQSCTATGIQWDVRRSGASWSGWGRRQSSPATW